MPTTFYETQLIIFIVACALWLFVDNRISKKRNNSNDFATGVTEQDRSKLTRQYLLVFAIVMGM